MIFLENMMFLFPRSFTVTNSEVLLDMWRFSCTNSGGGCLNFTVSQKNILRLRSIQYVEKQFVKFCSSLLLDRFTNFTQVPFSSESSDNIQYCGFIQRSSRRRRLLRQSTIVLNSLNIVSGDPSFSTWENQKSVGFEQKFEFFSGLRNDVPNLRQIQSYPYKVVLLLILYDSMKVLLALLEV